MVELHELAGHLILFLLIADGPQGPGLPVLKQLLLIATDVVNQFGSLLFQPLHLIDIAEKLTSAHHVGLDLKLELSCPDDTADDWGDILALRRLFNVRNRVNRQSLLPIEVLGHHSHLVGHLNHERLPFNLHDRLYRLLAHETAPSLELPHSLCRSGLLFVEYLLPELVTNVSLYFEQVILILLLGGYPRVRQLLTDVERLAVPESVEEILNLELLLVLL